MDTFWIPPIQILQLCPFNWKSKCQELINFPFSFFMFIFFPFLTISLSNSFLSLSGRTWFQFWATKGRKTMVWAWWWVGNWSQHLSYNAENWRTSFEQPKAERWWCGCDGSAVGASTYCRTHRIERSKGKTSFCLIKKKKQEY